MLRFCKLFRKEFCNAIGMVHVDALPGTPLYSGNINQIIDKAIKDAEVYRDCNIDGILVENMHDIPYVQPKELLPETCAMMTRVCTEIRKIIPERIPCGVQILAGCNKEAIAVAKASDFQFIRAEGFIFSHIADEGFTDANAGSLLRYRKYVDADNILIFADIKKKHSSHSITSDISISEAAKAASFFLADGVIVTGISTGDPADINQFKDTKKAVKNPVIIGSGITIENIENYKQANAIIVGTHFKVDGIWTNLVDKKRVSNFMAKLEKIDYAK